MCVYPTGWYAILNDFILLQYIRCIEHYANDFRNDLRHNAKYIEQLKLSCFVLCWARTHTVIRPFIRWRRCARQSARLKLPNNKPFYSWDNRQTAAAAAAAMQTRKEKKNTARKTKAKAKSETEGNEMPLDGGFPTLDYVASNRKRVRDSVYVPACEWVRLTVKLQCMQFQFASKLMTV